MAEGPAASFLFIEELFAAGDSRFLPALRQFYDPKPFAAFAARWLRDPRPWAREQLLAYLDQPLNVPNHNSLVKRLFKGAEAAGDDGLMAAFAVAFDRLVRRVRHRRSHGFLRSPPNVLDPFPESWTVNRLHLEMIGKYGQRLFTYHTRYYLRRRAWRYFRRMAHQRPAKFVPAIVAMLGRYYDADLAAGGNVLDSWALMHACFFEHPAISFLTHRAVLAEGASIGSLEPAPDFPKLWQEASAARPLLLLVTSAPANLVRVWAAGLLRRWHLAALQGMSFDELTPLLLSADERVQMLGVDLLANAKGLAAVPFDRWLTLLQVKNLAVLQAIVDVMQRNLDVSTLSLFDLVRLASAQQSPVARMGLDFLRQRKIETQAHRQALTNLADAKAPAVGSDIAAYALSILGEPDVYDVAQVTRFFDSLLAEVRQGAWNWLMQRRGGWNDPALWSRLIESPYDDLKLSLVAVLEERAGPRDAPRSAAATMSPESLAPLWTSVLLNIHRGGRRKLTALRQISQAIKDFPAAAERLLPVLAVAIRSVRATEARAGLAAIVSAAAARPELQTSLSKELPELQIVSEAM